MSKFGVMNSLNISVCETATEAVAKGHVYRHPIKAVEIDKVVVIKDGTVRGGSTVDLVLKDEDGNQYFVMVTGALIKSIPC